MSKHRAQRARVPWLLVTALVLFLAVLGVSRLADFGILDGSPFGAQDVERNEVDVELNRDPLAIEYGPTRYPYIWIIGLDAQGKAHALVPERHTKANGETVEIRPLAGRFVLLCMFSAVPRTLEQIQAALDQDVRLPGLRYTWVIGDGRSERPESAEARIGTDGAPRP